MHTVRAMERLVITIRPAHGHDLLDVEDALQQVLDVVRLHDEAHQGGAPNDVPFTWRLEKATASSPLTVTAVATPEEPGVDVTIPARRSKERFRTGLGGLARTGDIPGWMGPEALRIARQLFVRAQNGIERTDIGSDSEEVFSIDAPIADAGAKAIAGITAISVEGEPLALEAWGEIEGEIVAAGRYYNRPAVQIRTNLYDTVWCQLADNLIERFGSAYKVSELWEDRTIGVTGKLVYRPNGRLRRIEAEEIREIQTPAPIALREIRDPTFTAGHDPVEYLRLLHNGELA